MTVYVCSNENCDRLISISVIPGGNPAAKMNPERWALAFGKCEKCGKISCDKCISSNGGKCPNCDEMVRVQSGHP